MSYVDGASGVQVSAAGIQVISNPVGPRGPPVYPYAGAPPTYPSQPPRYAGAPPSYPAPPSYAPVGYPGYPPQYVSYVGYPAGPPAGGPPPSSGKWETVSVVVGGGGAAPPPPNPSAVPSALRHVHGISIAGTIFALIACVTSAVAVATPWMSITYPDKSYYGYGLTFFYYCPFGGSCTSYTYFNSPVSVGFTVTTGITAAAASMLSIACVLFFILFVSGIAFACGTRNAINRANEIPRHCGCFGTGMTTTALAATGFTLSWVAGVLGNLVISRASLSWWYAGFSTSYRINFPGNDAMSSLFVTALITMALWIAVKCHLREVGHHTKSTLLAALLGAVPSESCC